MKKTIRIIAILVLFMALPAFADMTLNIKLNFFGPAAAGKGGPGVTTSFYLKSMVQRNLQVPFSTTDLKAELQKTFNVPSISLLAEGDLVWKSGGEPSVMQIVQIDGREIALVLTPLPKPGVVNFKVGVVEENSKNKIKNILLDTEIVLPDAEVAMLGFRDARENSYFIVFYVQERIDKISKDVLQIAASQKPKKIKEVKPVYPEEALKNRVQGIVALNVETDIYGRVSLVEVISGHPLLNDAAVSAVKQWVYEPYMVNGQAKAVAFTVTVTFALQGESEAKNDNNALNRLQGGQRPPRIIKKVRPVYPEEALKNKIEGVVILEAMIDEKGKVGAARIITSPSLLLNEAVLTAVRQWIYEPYMMDGKAKSVVFTVTVTFGFNDEPETKKNTALTRLQDSQRPRIIKKVKPVYPQLALQTRTQGIVKLNVEIDVNGRVQLAEVISGNPRLNEAAVTAVKKWVYEPYLVNGKAKPVAFIVTVTFNLQNP